MDQDQQFRVSNGITSLDAKMHRVNDLVMENFPENCGKRYALTDRDVVLEYVESI